MSRVIVETELLAPWLTDLADAASHLALMTANPFSVMDPLTVEVDGYSRAAVVWTITDRWITPSADLLFAGVPGGVTVTYLAGFDAVYNGTCGWAIQVSGLVTPTYGTLTMDNADVIVGFGALT